MRIQTVFHAKSPSFTLRYFLVALVVAMPCAALAMVLDPLPPGMEEPLGPSTQAPQAAPVPLQATETFRTEELSLQVGKFSVVGDLIIPTKGDKHPVLIIVPGDGPFTRAQGLSQLRMMGVFDYLMAEGYAVFIDDKPGCGASKGMFSEDNLLHERATVLAHWIGRLKTHPAVDAKGIGVAGQSQAGYVMPLAMAEAPDIAFMIALSCPAVDGVTQFAYLIEKQLLCDGIPEQEARKAHDAFLQREKARSYQEYRKAAEFLASIPAAQEWVRGDIQTEQEFRPADPGSEDFFNPVRILEKTAIPVLALFGEKDTQVDPVQGMKAYQNALRAAGNPFFQVTTIPNADHILSIAKTGSIKELQDKFRTGDITFAPECSATLREWLTKLTPYLRSRNKAR